jgi:hypothetical protein
MPVHVSGKTIIETATGKVVGRASSKRNAHISAGIRNRAHRRKRRRRTALTGDR